MTRPQLHRSLRAGLLALVPVVIGACAPGLDVKGFAEPRLTLGSRTLVVTDAEGSRAAVGLVMDEAFAQLAENHWFTPADGTDDMLVIRRGAGTLLDAGALETGVAYLRLDVLAADAVLEVHTDEGVDEFGNTVFIESESTSVRVLVSALVARADGTIITGLQAEGVAAQEGPASELDLIQLAAAEAVREVLVEITPPVTQQRVPFDARDAEQKRIVEMATSRDIDDAMAAEVQVLATAPVPAAHYNYGVMLDYRGLHTEALASYEAARVGADAELASLVTAAVDGCESRIAALASLGAH